MATQCNVDPYSIKQKVFEGVFSCDVDADFIVSCVMWYLMLLRLCNHAFLLFPLADDGSTAFLLATLDGT